MPRSGTTLTESILSTAKNIKPGGEKTFFTNNLSDEHAIAYINNRSGCWSENFTLREVLSYY